MPTRHPLGLFACVAALAVVGAVSLRAEAAADPDRITMTPSALSGTAGAPQCVTAFVQGSVAFPVPGLVPVPDVTVVFTVTGANAASGSATTDVNGEATFCYTPATNGGDRIDVYADSNGNGRPDLGEPGTFVTAEYTAARASGRLRAWGSGFYGQLGDGAGAGLGSGQWPSSLYQASAGSHHTVIVAQDGTVWAAGLTMFGQAGWDTGSWGCGGIYPCNFWPSQLNKNRPLTDPPPPPDYLTRITSVAAGGSHSLALDEDGTVWAWGSNAASQARKRRGRRGLVL